MEVTGEGGGYWGDREGSREGGRKLTSGKIS